ncbi:hypothetical protein MWU38_09680 [Qipengyuania sp. S6317L1]|uniref:hypothetical protein n=1 Tax=Qipengyuania sp. S6317L1 TaxID=2926410 RepID=UPI001FF63037|nr:hypothetical protein [Qipengyuania sp. S6317L1]MCK0099652.1 hypothetical protein [Qipengyuania sp. S6317L1]
MPQDTFLPRCHPHMLGEDGHVDLARCEELAADMADLKELGIILTLVGSYAVGANRYSNLSDALAQARAKRSEGSDADTRARGRLLNGH